MTAPLENKARHEPDATLLDGLTFADLIVALRQIAAFVRKYWLRIAIATVVGGIIGAALAFATPKTHRATFEVRLVPRVADNPVAAFSRSNVEFFASAEQNFRSIALIQKTCEKLEIPTVQPETLADIQHRLSFYPIAENTYRGNFSSADAEQALAFLSQHADLYLNEEIEKTLGIIRSELDFLSDRLDEVEEELVEDESALQEFREKHADGLPEQAEQHYNTLRGLQIRNIECAAELEQVALELKLNREKLAGEKVFVESKVISTQRKTPFEDNVVRLRMELAAARAAGMNDDHPKIKKLLEMIERNTELAKEQASVKETETEQSRNPIYQSIQDTIYQLEVQESVARNRQQQIARDLERVTKIVSELPELERRYAQLTRNYEATSDLQKRIFKQFKVTELQLSLEKTAAESRYDIITPPRIVWESPMKKIVMMGIMGSMALGGLMLAICLLLELREHVRHLL